MEVNFALSKRCPFPPPKAPCLLCQTTIQRCILPLRLSNRLPGQSLYDGVSVSLCLRWCLCLRFWLRVGSVTLITAWKFFYAEKTGPIVRVHCPPNVCWHTHMHMLTRKGYAFGETTNKKPGCIRQMVFCVLLRAKVIPQPCLHMHDFVYLLSLGQCHNLSIERIPPSLSIMLAVPQLLFLPCWQGQRHFHPCQQSERVQRPAIGFGCPCGP